MMDTQPDFLPPMLDLYGPYTQIIERLYEVFHRDFIKDRATHLNRAVTFNGVINESSQGKPEGFWHVVTRADTTQSNRLLDYRRAERLPWAKPLMKRPVHNEIAFFFL
jgi:hypothetical protein